MFLAILLVAGAGCGGAARGGNWPLPNLNRSSTRAVSTSPIDSGNVKQLHVVWRFRFTESTIPDLQRSPEQHRGVVATPVVANGTVFVQDSTSSVYAIDERTGKLRWEHRFRAPNFGRNGVAYSSGSIYGSTDTTAFALSAATGRMIWQRRLVTPTEQYVDIAPLIADNIVYLSTVGYPPGGKGALYALNAHSGAVLWRFSTIRKGWPDPAQTGGGGAWYTPSLDAQGRLYTGVANPYPLGGSTAHPNGGAYPGPVLYTDSLLVLNGESGALDWYDQVTPHDVRDYDFQLPPVLVNGANSSPVAIGAGKAGIVIAWNRDTHKRIWQTSVGRHVNDTGPLPLRSVTVCPGFFGGVETPLAVASARVFVPVVNLCAQGGAKGYQSVQSLDPTHGTGEFEALSATTGAVLWKRVLPQPDFGCATVASNVVFTSTFDGRIYAFGAANGKTVWQARSPAGIIGCPAVVGDTLLVPAGSGTSRMNDPEYELVAYALR
jgi:outer membrane protein assembly factor BamB